MKLRRCMAALLAAIVFLVLLGTADAGPFFFGRTAIPPVYNVYPWGYVYPPFNPYAAPLPAYGVMPLPLATYQMMGYDPYFGGRDSQGPTTDSLDYIPRKRPSLYPAVPYNPTPEKSAEDRRRARFEITVPTANAILTYDGVKTKQTGLSRTFVTPPLTEDKLYTATIEVQWNDEAGTKITRRRVFEFVAGETLTHRFTE